MAATKKPKRTPAKPKRKSPAATRRIQKKARRKQTAVTATSAQHDPKRPNSGLQSAPRFTEPLRRTSEFENVRALIEGQAAKLGARTFLIHEDDGREYSFAKLDENTSRVANVLRELGAVRGSRIALVLANSPDFVFAFLGAMKGGYIAVPLNLELPVETIRFILEDSGANFLVTDDANWQRLQGIAENLPGLDAVLVAGKPGGGVAPSHKQKGGRGLRVADLHGSMEAAGDGVVQSEPIGWWDEAQIIYTGHELDQPRGAILQHRQFLTSSRWLSIWLNLGDNQRYMSALPLFHPNAQIVTLFMPLQSGASAVLSREFNVTRVWKAVERYRVTTLSAVPSMLGILTERELSEATRDVAMAQAAWPAAYESPGTIRRREDAGARDQGLARAHDISSLERIICGAAPLPAAVQKAFEKCFLVPVIEGFSTAETTGFATLNPGTGSRKIGSAGVSVGDKVAIQDDRRPPRPLDDWQPTNFLRMSPAVFPTADIDEPGEICIWGENVLREYLHRPQLNPIAFAGGWFHTGDVGRMDCDGFVYVLGDKDEMIDLGAERLMPREVDEVLFAHHKIESVATVGVERPRKRPQVTTWVVMKEGTFPGGADNGRLPVNGSQAETVRAEIAEFLASRLPEKRRPSSFIFARRLPRDVAGKTRVIELRRLFRDGKTDE